MKDLEKIYMRNSSLYIPFSLDSTKDKGINMPSILNWNIIPFCSWLQIYISLCLQILLLLFFLPGWLQLVHLPLEKKYLLLLLVLYISARSSSHFPPEPAVSFSKSPTIKWKFILVLRYLRKLSKGRRKR